MPRPRKPPPPLRVLERGEISLGYRPRVGDDAPPVRLEDVQRLHAILAPRGRALFRRLIIGRKRLPDIGEHERNWAFVDRVATRREDVTRDLVAYRYLTKTRGEREQPAARPAGEGVYAIVEHGAHVHLSYALALPAELDEVLLAIGVHPEASYIAAVRNPEVWAPPRGSLRPGDRAAYPSELQERFGERRFVPLDPAYLDHEGAELILIGARDEVSFEELGMA